MDSKELKKKLKDVCKKMSLNAEEDLQHEYTENVTQFYDDYEPKYYFRHHENGFSERGLDRTISSYHKQEGNTYIGGIIVSTNNMYKDYDRTTGNPAQVLYSFTEGFHGLPLPTTFRSSIRPIDNMMKFRKLLIKKYEKHIMSEFN